MCVHCVYTHESLGTAFSGLSIEKVRKHLVFLPASLCRNSLHMAGLVAHNLMQEPVSREGKWLPCHMASKWPG